MTIAAEFANQSTLASQPAATPESLTYEAEEQLVVSLRRGEDCGYETLVRSFGPQVMAVAKRYLNSDADAADCFQDTFIAIFRTIDGYQKRSTLRHWVRGVTVNQCLMKLRKRQRYREESIEHMLPMFDDRGKRVDVATPGQKAAVDKLLDTEQLRRTVREQIGKLPYDYRLVILLRDIDGYSTNEAASILGIKINAVKTRLHRARLALKFMLEPLLENTDCHVDV